MARERVSERENERVGDTRVIERIQSRSDTRVLGEKIQVGNEGWIPVLRNHRGKGVPKEANIFTLFVDNIPDQKDHLWLHKTFSRFGEVKGVFIPHKRSKRTGRKFGFVRFESQGAANLAVGKLNGLWVDNDRLFVKEAFFGLNQTNKEQTLKIILPQEGRGKGVMMDQEKVVIREKHFGMGRSYSDIIRGDSSKGGDCNKFKLSVKSSGNGWLERSAVARLCRQVPLSKLQVSFSMSTNKVAQFRSLGGRAVLITFQSSEVRDGMIKDPWMKTWFEKVNPWRGEPACLERLVWLGCKGVPLSASWNMSTFQEIGEMWGTYLQTDEQTLKDLSFVEGRVLIATEEALRIDRWINIIVDSVNYNVKITELSSFSNP